MRNLKKIALLVLAISVLVFSFTSCDVVQDLASKIPGLDSILGTNGDHVHAFGDATCTTPATCECGETEGEALGHNFADGKCTVCRKKILTTFPLIPITMRQ